MTQRGNRGMTVRFVKLSDQRHRVEVHRVDGSSDAVELDSRSYLRHDLAHYAVEAALDLDGGVWGSVAGGGGFDGRDLDGPDMALAETLAGPVQTMMRVGATGRQVSDMLARVLPGIATSELADTLHARMRSLTGHWRNTPYGDAMELEWPPPPR